MNVFMLGVEAFFYSRHDPAEAEVGDKEWISVAL